MTRTRIAISLFVLAALAVFFWPPPQRSFAELSAQVPEDVRQSLLDFRADYPLQHVQVDGLDWEYLVLGEGEETVLFLHGMTGAYDIWWQQMLALMPDYRVISLTYPPADTLEAMSKGVIAILDAEGIRRTHVVGSSLGGYLAQYLMQTHPDRLDKVVLANTFPPNDVLRAKNEKIIALLPFLPEWAVMRVFRQSFTDDIYPAAGYSELVLAYLLEQASGRMSKAQVIARAKAVIEPFAPAEATSLPLLIIEADNDPLVEASLRAALRETYPTAEVQTLHGAGHFPYLNEATTYTQWLRAFLQP